MMTVATVGAGRQCARCGTRYTTEEVVSGQAFLPVHRRRTDASVPRWRPACRVCEETARDQRKGGDREIVKAAGARRGHAIKLARPRMASGVEAWHDPSLSATELEAVYGWDKAQMAHDIRFQYGNGCSYCHHLYKAMGHGLADITIDIYDPRLPPDYSNTRWCCMTCQRRKGLLTPEQWAIKQRIYRKWEANQALAPEDRGMLF